MGGHNKPYLSLSLYIYIYRSEGFPRTGYFIPGRDGTRAWQISRVVRAARALFTDFSTPALALTRCWQHPAPIGCVGFDLVSLEHGLLYGLWGVDPC